jgi:hypothetical protein
LAPWRRECAGLVRWRNPASPPEIVELRACRANGWVCHNLTRVAIVPHHQTTWVVECCLEQHKTTQVISRHSTQPARSAASVESWWRPLPPTHLLGAEHQADHPRSRGPKGRKPRYQPTARQAELNQGRQVRPYVRHRTTARPSEPAAPAIVELRASYDHSSPIPQADAGNVELRSRARGGHPKSCRKRRRKDWGVPCVCGSQGVIRRPLTPWE